MRIIKVCVTCIGAVIFESILCLSRVLSHIVQRVSAEVIVVEINN